GRAVQALKDNDAGAVGVRVENTDGSQQICVRKFPSLYSEIITLLKLNSIIPALNRSYLQLDFDYDKTQPVDSVIGAFMLMSRELYLTGGGFDESYFIWFEEVDLCRRLTTAGRPVWYCASAKIVHHGGQSFSQLATGQRQELFNKALLNYAARHQPGWQYFILRRLILPVNRLLTGIQQRLKMKRHGY
ncbi:MAG: hypothetical protein NUV82_03720, partial [Candidatus Komeilibacteria bacterium]|nr:hypothetical protein [Candidatus Komeilibacteria bacterium]